MALRRGVLVPARGDQPEHVILVPVTAEMTLRQLLAEVSIRAERDDFAFLSFRQSGDVRQFQVNDPDELVVTATKESEMLVAEVDPEAASDKTPAAPSGGEAPMEDVTAGSTTFPAPSSSSAARPRPSVAPREGGGGYVYRPSVAPRDGVGGPAEQDPRTRDTRPVL